jgi:hypothetical protein
MNPNCAEHDSKERLGIIHVFKKKDESKSCIT